MEKFLTVVIRYEEDAEQPSFHANMELLGGVIDSVMFANGLYELEIAEEALEEYRINGDK